MTNFIFFPEKDGKVKVQGNCRLCGKGWTLILDKKPFYKYINGKILIQDAFPDLSLEDRELLTGGWCHDCYKKLNLD